MTIKFVSNDKGAPGLKLAGFIVWARKLGGRNVTYPARTYSINGERRSYALLRPIADQASQTRLTEIILDAYREFERETGSAQPAAAASLAGR